MENQNQTTERKKLSYEELEKVCGQLSAQAQQLKNQNQQLINAVRSANLENLYKRLDYLFKVIEENATNKYLSEEFKEQCGSEIELLMARPDSAEDKEDNKEEK